MAPSALVALLALLAGLLLAMPQSFAVEEMRARPRAEAQ